ncbi:MAG: hypothetical protein V9E99_18465 [Microthrixaceae bacterium]|nr:hypothetical protein [Actinomycetota bacterium]MBP6729410.1 hypothetical protein [Microthrixaceae bacterium]HMS12779.1 hypothetical protein [Microthrixaceae bacterium]HMT24820.1 hypothetical protein [Microthrixaceae bacterium]
MRPRATCALLRRSAFAAALTIGLAAAGTACGTEETFPEAEFVKALEAPGISKSVATCVYAQVKGDAKVMQDIVDANGPTDDVSTKTSNKLAGFLADCIGKEAEKESAATSTTTTSVADETSSPTDEPTSTTTTSGSGSKRTTTTAAAATDEA